MYIHVLSSNIYSTVKAQRKLTSLKSQVSFLLHKQNFTDTVFNSNSGLLPWKVPFRGDVCLKHSGQRDRKVSKQ